MNPVADALWLSAALALTCAGSAGFYLSSPHQRWRAHAWPKRPARALGGALLLGGLFAFGQAMQALAAVFAFATCLMLACAAWPYLGALRAMQPSPEK